MQQIHQFKEISDHLRTRNLQIQEKLSDFVVYNWEEVNHDACADELPYRNHYFEIVLELASGCGLNVDQFEFPSTEGKLFFISPYRLQSCNGDHNGGIGKGFTILFKPEFIHMSSPRLQDFPFFDHFNSPGISLGEKEVNDMLELFAKIQLEYNNYGVYSREIIKNYLNILLLKGQSFYQYQLPSSGSISRDREIYNEFMMLVQKHFLEFDGLKNYADRIHISVKHLSETVKNISGESALRIIHNARIHHAKSLLRQTSMTVSQIAYELKFETPDYFSVFFKRFTGQSPMQFRNS